MFVATPVAVTVYICYLVDKQTQIITKVIFGKPIPVLGFLIALVAIYLCGLIATSLLGKWAFGLVDRMLSRIPGLKSLYLAWKQIALTPGGTEGTFAKVVLIPADAAGHALQIGFCSGQPLDGDPNTMCVFVPAAPNPMNGRMYFVPRDKCLFIDAAPEEAFKTVLSTGNYIPSTIGASVRRLAASQTSAAALTMSADDHRADSPDRTDRND